MTQWVWYAVVAMVVLSFSNLAFKIFSRDNPYDVKQLWPIIAFFAFAAVASFLYLHFSLKAPPAFTGLFLALLVLSALAVGLIFLSLKTGKVAIVSAILSLATIGVAVLSFLFLGDRFSGKEMAGLALALLSLFFLVV